MALLAELSKMPTKHVQKRDPRSPFDWPSGSVELRQGSVLDNHHFHLTLSILSTRQYDGRKAQGRVIGHAGPTIQACANDSNDPFRAS